MELQCLDARLSNRVFLPRAYGAMRSAVFSINDPDENTFQYGCSTLATALELVLKDMIEYCGIEVRKTYSLSSLMSMVPADAGFVSPELRDYFQFRLDTVSSWYLSCKYNSNFFVEHDGAMDILKHTMQLMNEYTSVLLSSDAYSKPGDGRSSYHGAVGFMRLE